MLGRGVLNRYYSHSGDSTANLIFPPNYSPGSSVAVGGRGGAGEGEKFVGGGGHLGQTRNFFQTSILVPFEEWYLGATVC